MNRPSFDLAVVDQPHPGLGERGDGGRLPARRAERERGPRLVVVLDEPHQAALIAEVRLKVPANLRRRSVHQPVVETLVVAVVEALLLQLPLQVPVGLGDEDEARPRSAVPSAITVGQYSAAGSGPTASPQVRANTSFMTSMAMSHRTPSHWSAIPINVCDHQRSQLRARTR